MNHDEQGSGRARWLWRGGALVACFGALLVWGCAPDLEDAPIERWDVNTDALVRKPADHGLWYVEVTEGGQTSRRAASILITEDVVAFFEAEVCEFAYAPGSFYACDSMDELLLALPVSSHSSLRSSPEERCFVSGEGGSYVCRPKDGLPWYERDHMSLVEELAPTLGGGVTGCELGGDFEPVGDVEIELTSERAITSISLTMKGTCVGDDTERILHIVLHQRGD